MTFAAGEDAADMVQEELCAAATENADLPEQIVNTLSFTDLFTELVDPVRTLLLLMSTNPDPYARGLIHTGSNTRREEMGPVPFVCVTLRPTLLSMQCIQNLFFSRPLASSPVWMGLHPKLDSDTPGAA